MVWQPFPIVTGNVLFQYGCQSAKLLSTSAKNCSQSACFGTTSTMNVDFAAFVFCDDLCCAGDCSTVKVPTTSCFVPCQESSLGCPWSYRLIFLGNDCLLFFLLFRTFLFRFWNWWFLWQLWTELCRNTWHSCLVSGWIPPNSALLPNHHKQSVMMVLHVEVVLELPSQHFVTNQTCPLLAVQPRLVPFMMLHIEAILNNLIVRNSLCSSTITDAMSQKLNPSSRHRFTWTLVHAMQPYWSQYWAQNSTRLHSHRRPCTRHSMRLCWQPLPHVRRRPLQCHRSFLSLTNLLQPHAFVDKRKDTWCSVSNEWQRNAIKRSFPIETTRTQRNQKSACKWKEANNPTTNKEARRNEKPNKKPTVQRQTKRTRRCNNK